MKYIIDHRYKKINALCVHTQSILSSCKRGRSVDLGISLRALQNELSDLESLKSPPFTKEQIHQIDEIEEKAHRFLLLPEEVESMGQELLEASERLLIEIDPFSLSFDESIGVRKARLVELAQEIQIYIEAHLLFLEGKASSMVDEKLIIQDIVQDVSRIDTKELKKPEMAMVEKIISLNHQYQNDATIKTTSEFFQLAVEAEHLFRGNKTPYRTLSELIQFLLKIYQETDKQMTSEKADFPNFTTPLRTPQVKEAIKRLKSLKLNAKALIASRDNILFAYENGNLEDGDTFISRCRAIDFYKLFGHELDEFDDLLKDRPDRDLKIF